MPLSPIREITALNLESLHNNLGFNFDAHAQPLDTAIDLNFPGVETQHATHSIHPYVAAINPPLASALIRHYVPEGETVLDPFCGGGGVLIESVLNNRRAVGCDINPLAVLLSRVKTRQLSAADTMREFKRVFERAQKAAPTVNVEEVPDVVGFWYLEQSLGPLKALQLAVLAIKAEPVREFFQAVLSATARDVMLTYRGEIRLRKLQGRDLERFKPNVFAAFQKRALAAVENVAALPPNIHANVYSLDCRKLGERQRCHTVITSPPYGDDKNGVGYFQFSRNMLFWIGFPLEQLRQERDAFLGANVRVGDSLPVSATLERTLAIIEQRKAAHHREATSFYADYFNALQRIGTVTEHRAIIIIGDRVLARTKINNGHITTEFMENLGWNLEHYYTRQLLKKRIANLGGDGGGISLEHIMIFRRG
jgi:site-specific DNA-methyltransferase (cytosine-N4-specific)